ncbi:EAL domain-containing protein [Pseudalkalibacillus hwajinpoensis]|uniref:EAL domain-containing protein n=1 Tax=Guptibacillus hwajinpoensis TaxID=208199 RepID=A0A4U1MLV0_9BACL|nr:EAL domain-containing protein [Pseudalkalibacillus hwajinpoensis]TKD71532.1 EAL domain-containing protein [Pseudalkalibacillus hwajinpoensis]
MLACSKCNAIPQILLEGYLEVYTPAPQLVESLREIFNLESANPIVVSYDNEHELKELCELINNSFNKAAKEMFYCSTLTEPGIKGATAITFPHFYSRVQRPDYIEIMNGSLFTNHMQPIIKLEDNEITGYEFLMRPIKQDYPFQPYELFQMARESGLQSFLDSATRISSIRVSAETLPRGVKRFINFLPSSIYDPTHCLRTTFKAVEKYEVDPNDLVFEVVETEKINEIDHLKNIFNTYKAEGMKMALDDVGTGFATQEMLLELKPDFAKIDRSVISFCDQDIVKQSKLSELVSIAEAEGITLLAEGIERKEEAQFCQDVGMTYGQGYYFGRPAEQPISRIKV